jgi:hypothetical protein
MRNSGELRGTQDGSGRWRWLLAATAVLVLAALLRLAALRDVPPGLAQDEVLDAGIAGMIRQGQYALFFREGYGHEPLYHYLAAPFGGLLGENFLSIRLPSVYLGLLLVALTMAWVRRAFGRWVGLTAGAGLAVSWWPIIFSRIGIRPILEPVLLLLMAWFWWKRPWLAGLFLALAVYSYTPARLFLGLPVLWLLYLGVLRVAYSVEERELMGTRGNSGELGGTLGTQGNSRSSHFTFHISRFTFHISRFTFHAIRNPLLILTTALLLCLPLYLTLRADPTLQQRVEQLSGPVEALQQGDWRPVVQATLATLGVFSVAGDPRWTYSLPGRPLFDPVTSLLFYAGLVLALVRWRQPAYAFTLIWLAVGLLPSAVTPDAPSTVRLVGAVPAVYILLGVGAKGILDFGFWILDWRKSKIQNPKSKITAAWTAVLLGLLGWNVARTAADGFGRWAAEAETGLRYQRALLAIVEHWQQEPAGAAVIADSFYEPIDHYSLWRTLGGAMPERWVQGGAAIIFPAGGQGGWLYVPEYAPLAAELRLAAGVTEPPVYRREGRPSVAVYELPVEPAVSLNTLAVSFEEQITLAGYRLLPQQGEEALRLLTYWRVERDELPWDLAIFVHLLDENGEMVAQWDGLDAAADTLQAGDHFLQLHTLMLPAERPAGPYQLQLGLYERGNGRRLTHPGEPADRVVLETNIVIDGE